MVTLSGDILWLIFLTKGEKLGALFVWGDAFMPQWIEEGIC